MIPLTYEFLNTCNPFYFGNILAGWSGKKNQCRHVFLNELSVQNDSLLLAHYSDDQMSFIENALKDVHTSGIILFTKQNVYVPSYITDLANQLKKPLLLLINQEEDLLYKKANQILHLYQNNLVEFVTNDLTTYWLQLFYQKSIEQVIQRLNTLMEQEVFFFTNKKEFLAIGSSACAVKDLKELESADDDSLYSNKQVFLVHHNRVEFYLYTILDPNNQMIGYFLFEKIRPLEDIQIQLLQTITPVIITWLKQVESTRNVHLKYKDQFMHDILNNNIETEYELIELGKLWEMEFRPHAYVLAIDLLSNQIITKDTQLSIQDLLTGANFLEMNIHTTYISHRIAAIIFPAGRNEKITKDDLHHLINDVQLQISKMFPFIQTIVGVGRSYYSNLEIYRSFQEAKIALQMYDYVLGTEGIIHYEDLGYVRLLSYIHDDLLNDFSIQYLGELEKHDRENETEYVRTLYTYCNHNGDINQSAQSLFIHQNTLRQRLKKIESILNVQLHHYTDLVNLILSLKISQDMNK